MTTVAYRVMMYNTKSFTNLFIMIYMYVMIYVCTLIICDNINSTYSCAKPQKL